MARASFNDIRPLAQSVLTQNDFILNLGVVPGSGFTQSQEALLKCIHIALPAVEIEPLVVDIRGFKVIHRGIKKFGSQTFSCEFLVSADTGFLGYNADSYNLIYNWLNFIADTDEGYSQPGKTKLFSGLQGMTQGVTGKLVKNFIGDINPNVINNSKAAYALDAVSLNIYNTQGDLTIKVSLDGVFPITLEGLEFVSNQVEKQVLKVRAEFAFDSYTISDIVSTKVLNTVNRQIDKLISKVSPKIPSSIKKLSRAF